MHIEKSFIICLVCVTSVIHFSQIQASESQVISNYICKKGESIRKVENVTEPNYACRVRYTKSSGISYPWSARNDATYCSSKINLLAKKLETFGWSCDLLDTTPGISSLDYRDQLKTQIRIYDSKLSETNQTDDRCGSIGEVQFGNVCGNDKDEAVRLYSCNFGAGGWSQKLLIFRQNVNDPIEFTIGARGVREMNWFRINENSIVTNTQKNDYLLDSDKKYPEIINTFNCMYSQEHSIWEVVEQN
jgi:hypothetical protein